MSADRYNLVNLPQSRIKEVNHAGSLSEDVSKLYRDRDYSDASLIVGDVVFPVHKVILACRSEYFRALFFGGLAESNRQEIVLKNINANSFQFLLLYIYTGKLNLTDLKEDVLLDLLGLSHQYNFVDLENALSEFLKANLQFSNISVIYNLATVYNLSSLSSSCLEFLDRNAIKILDATVGNSEEGLLGLEYQALEKLISRDSFFADECLIFKAIRSWCQARSRDQNSDSLLNIYSHIRLELISMDDLLDVVRHSKAISPELLLDAIDQKNKRRDSELRYRGILLPEENLATQQFGASVTKGECRLVLLDGDTINYDLDRGFTRHPIDDKNGAIVVKLGQPSIINTIKLLLWDKDMRSYGYYVQVSMNEIDWVTVIDHRGFLCRSWQELHFQPRVVRFIKVVGTHNSVNRVFHLVSLEAFFSKTDFQLSDGLLLPTQNVATVQKSACVIEGVSRLRNALINGDTKNYDWDSGYTCHQLGNGAIVVQLSQPYIIGSMRLLLWDLDDRAYSFTVETSCDQASWETVWDASKSQCKSWRVLVFEPRPVVFIRIIGVSNTANEVFHVVHFECPCDKDALESFLQKNPGVVKTRKRHVKQEVQEIEESDITEIDNDEQGHEDIPVDVEEAEDENGHDSLQGHASDEQMSDGSSARTRALMLDRHPQWATARPDSND